MDEYLHLEEIYAVMEKDPEKQKFLDEQFIFRRLARLVNEYVVAYEEEGVIAATKALVDETLLNGRFIFYDRFRERYAGYDQQKAAFVLVLASHFQRHGVLPWRATKNMSRRFSEEADFTIGELVDSGDATTIGEDLEMESRDSYNRPVLLSPKACRYLFKGLQRHVNLASGMARFGEWTKSESIEEHSLFFAEPTAGDVRRLTDSLGKEKYGEIIEHLTEKGRHKALTCLLYGPPGTGKTELAHQFARRSGRSILSVDISKLTGSYVGESERNYREMFAAYGYAVHIMDTAPILLLNEADAFLSKRTTVTRSNDKYENNVQTILLEELEKFEGILLATTNNVSNMDEAFNRRFLIKVEIPSPTTDVRRMIWKEMIPTLKDDQLDVLADSYQLSGAQIENVATRFDIMSVLEGQDPEFGELTRLCREEGRSQLNI